jgi:hypothetical protein
VLASFREISDRQDRYPLTYKDMHMRHARVLIREIAVDPTGLTAPAAAHNRDGRLHRDGITLSQAAWSQRALPAQ